MSRRNHAMPFHAAGQVPLCSESIEVPAVVISRFLERLTPIGDKGCEIIRAVYKDGKPKALDLLYYSSVSWTDHARIKRTIKAHRLALTLKIGPVPIDLLALHRCDVSACCSLDHVRPGSDADNRADRSHAERSRRYGWTPTLHPYGREMSCHEARPG